MTANGRTVELIFPEDELARLLSQKVGRVVSRARLLLALWGRVESRIVSWDRAFQARIVS